MAITIEDRPDCRVIRIRGLLDGRTAESRETERTLGEQGQHPDRHCVLDLSAVDYVNSSMLGSFIRFLSDLQDHDFRLFLLRPPASVRSVLELTGLTRLLAVVADESEIASALACPSGATVPAADVDYEALAQEIDEVTQQGSPPEPKDGQIARLLGADS